MSILLFAESFTRLLSVINTTFRGKIYSRWCCIDPAELAPLTEMWLDVQRRLVFAFASTSQIYLSLRKA